MSPNDLIFIAALVLIAVCAYLVGFNFFAALGFSLALGLVFYLVQTGSKGNSDTPQKR
jgi:hypothetical protein